MMILVACEHVGFRRKESMTTFLCVDVRCYVYGVLNWLVGPLPYLIPTY